jgi:phosphoribosyl-ATP pyrophosphohydrolase
MNIRIPKNRWESLVSIADMSADAVKTLFAALVQVPPQKFGPELPAQLAESLQGTDFENISEVADTLFSLMPLLIDSGKPVNEVVEQLLTAVRTQSPQGKEVSEEKIERLRTNLQKLLRVPSMYMGAKATSVITDNQSTFLSARILTDVRPVFALESTDVAGAVIIHNLKVSFASEGENEREFFVAMDDVDVQTLIATLQRAQEKGSKLRKFLDVATLPVITLERV